MKEEQLEAIQTAISHFGQSTILPSRICTFMMSAIPMLITDISFGFQLLTSAVTENLQSVSIPLQTDILPMDFQANCRCRQNGLCPVLYPLVGDGLGDVALTASLSYPP